MEDSHTVSLKTKLFELETKFEADHIEQKSNCKQCLDAIRSCYAQHPSSMFNSEPPNANMLQSCNKVLDDCQSTIAFYFNLAKQMKLPGAHESDELDFSSPASILAFLKKLFGQLIVLDKRECCEADEDKRSSIFRDKIFQRFALLFYFNHALASEANKLAQTHSECGSVLETQQIALAAKERALIDLKSVLEARLEEKQK